MRERFLLVGSIIIIVLVLLFGINKLSSVSYIIRKASVCDREGKPDEAISLLRLAISREPDNIVAHINLGAVHFGKVAFEKSLSENILNVDNMLHEHELALALVVEQGGESVSNLCDIAYSNTRELLRWFESGRKKGLLSGDHIAGLDVQMKRAKLIIKEYEEYFEQTRKIYNDSRGEVDGAVSNLIENAKQLNDKNNI